MSDRNSSGSSAIKYEDGVKAAKIVLDRAASIKVKAAVCGGLALHLYGFTRATKDVDILAEKKLDFKDVKKLNFGGTVYIIDVDGVKIEVDLIIRSDEIKELYQLALEAAKIDKKSGLRVITPEWLVILKYLAGRGKDQIDLLWLLREDGLVDRKKVNNILKKNMGKHSYWATRDLENVYLEADILRARDNRPN